MLQYVGHHQRPLDAVRGLLGGGDEVFAAVAYVKQPGVALIQKEVQALRRRGGQLSLLTSFDFNYTDPAALDTLVGLGAAVRIHRGPTFHPKAYLANRGEERAVLLGSANLTGGALIRNVEAGVLLTEAHADTVYADARAHLDGLWQASAAYVLGTQRHTPQPMLAAQPGSPPSVQDLIVALFARQRVVQTASGLANHLLQLDLAAGVLVGTQRSPRGQWVPWWMLEVVVTWLDLYGRLRLNTAADSGIPDCTRYLRVHRSSAVFAILGALPGYRLRTRPAVLERV